MTELKDWGLKDMKTYLAPVYDARASFGQKAIVTISDVGEMTLTSYTTDVAHISDGRLVLMDGWNCSQTTLRHVKEFARQNGFKADNAAQMGMDYV